MKKTLTGVLLTVWAVLCSAQEKDPALLFSVDFDNYSTRAVYAAGSPEGKGISSDLSLRMFTGAAGKGNAVKLKGTERITYSAHKNFNSGQGTISFWISPQLWNKNKRGLTTFFETRFGNYFFKLYEENKYGRFSFVIYTYNPKYNEIGQARFAISAKDWGKGRWHKIDAVWNEKMMGLYLDGAIAKPLPYQKNPYFFPKARKFPAVKPNTRMQLGWGHRTVADETAFDDFKIYDRVLSAGEILAEYEKKIPRKQSGKRPEVMVPTGKKITVDGRIDAKEWSDASAIVIRNPEGSGTVMDLTARVMIKKNAADLMLAAEILGGKKADITGNDIVDIWRDDAFEFHVMTADKKRYQFIVNPAGALFDAVINRSDGIYDNRQLGHKWQSGARYAVKKGSGKWFVEMVIPRKNIGAMQKNLLVNFCAARYGERPDYIVWATDCKGFGNEKRFGILHFASKARTVRMEKCELADGEFRLELTPGVSARVTAADGKVMPRPAGKSWNLPLSEGVYEFTAQAKDFFYAARLSASKPFELDYVARPSLKKIETLVDLSGAGADIRKKIAAKQIKCAVSLIDGGKKVQTVRTFSVQGLKSVFNLPLPEKLSRGTWQLKAEILENSKRLFAAQKRLRIPDMTPFKAKVELNHTVPPPWTPVKNLGGGRFQVWNRVYTFKNGPFPVQVSAEGKQLLDKKPDLYLAGKPVRWSAAKVVKTFDDEIRFAGTGSAAGLKFSWTSILSFDGLVDITVKMAPAAKSAEISNLKLSWQVPAEFARAMLSPLLTGWDNKEGEKYVFPYANNYDFCIWTMGIKHGFIWHPVNTANWRNPHGHKPFSMIRSGNTVKINADLITLKSKLTKEAVYKMVFMATPSRPEPHRRRDTNAGHIWGRIKHESWRVQYYLPTPKPVAYSTEPWTGLVAWDPKKYSAHIDKLEKEGTRYMPYSQPMMLENIDDYYDLFFKEWRQIQAYSCGSGVSYKTGEHYIAESCCGETGIEDLAVWRADNHFRDFPKIPGVYYDCAVARSCSNTLHGCGGTDAFGQSYASSAAVRCRRYYIRLKRVFAKHGADKILYLHAHERFLPFLHGLADYYCTGEQYFVTKVTNPRYFYSETVPLKRWQTLYYTPNRGTGYLFMTAYYYITGRKMTKENCRLPEYTWGIMTVCTLHDLNLAASWLNNAALEPWWIIKKDIDLADAEFNGYWFSDAVKSSGERIYTSWYSWKKPSPYSKLFFVGNLSRRDQKTDLAVNWKKLGLDPARVKMVDLWTKKPITSLKGIAVKSNNFRIIGILPQ